MPTHRSAHGLSSGPDVDWRQRAACRDMDPDMFQIRSGQLSKRNKKAVRACLSCPVRIECRDFHFGLSEPPQSTIAGGWRWNAHREPTPMVPGEGHLAPAAAPPEPKPPPPAAPRRPLLGGRPRSAATGKRFLDSGRALDADVPIGEVEQRYGFARSQVYSARLVLRHCPDLVDDIAAGNLSIHAARMEMYRRRAAR